jgi:prepilin-type N-terminal cleavage/methylation domain-containing protein
MTPDPAPAPRRRRGFTLVEVILAVGVVGIAIASLVGILATTFQQVDDIMQTNRALTAAQGLVTGLDNPRSILRELTVVSGLSHNNTSSAYLPSRSGIDNATGDAPNFDLAYNLLKGATSVDNAVWLYVYERKTVASIAEGVVSGSVVNYNLNANPALVEVVSMANETFPPDLAQARNVIGAPMRVRLTVSRLLVGQRVTLDTATGEPTTATWTAGAALPASPDGYALAYLPVVAEFFPHDYTPPATFKDREETPVLTQTIILNR